MKTLELLRIKLHANAELSGEEKKTNRILNDFLVRTNPDIHIKNIGGYGIAVMYKGVNPSKRVMIRADIDGLNIAEGDRPFSHRCGHDGHAAILCGLAQRLAKHRPDNLDVVLLFQPAEETGQGAAAVLEDEAFRLIKPDVAFALHNLPGYAKHQIVIRKDCFAAASQGLKLIFEGQTAHASQPETGKSPQFLLAALLDVFNQKADLLKKSVPLTMLTVTHAVLGEQTFGVAPGRAEIWLTLRSYDNEKMKELTDSCIHLGMHLEEKYGFRFTHSIHEAFAATLNTDNETDVVEKAASELHLSVKNLEEPFRWSEDFGRFGSVCPLSIFGLGCGFEHLPLHNPDYVFEDEIIDTGINMFEKILSLIK